MFKKWINICENYGKEYKVNFNTNIKILLMFNYNNKTDLKNINIKMNGKNTLTEKHLWLNMEVMNFITSQKKIQYTEYQF